MLTKNDLEKIQKLFDRNLEPIKKDIVSTKKNLVSIKSDIVQIRKDQKVIVNFFDREYLDLRKRVERIEEHLNLHSKN